ncbi:hypothetical protein ACWT_7203 [Actinoplanes sp. SE50]|uniref:DUF3515 family protein n=1 Tax=unclassified Actinoplanes TaxID=2626549 RepID=UPI00023EDE97|nr:MULTISPECIES: DUF3515 family protein [unclassified Actinoplanes]AEV88213.1 hypothetical protein ACPL_7333 [Actinoplanes sp. SE50/110]ATO86618.1 hypothetical protein ACWT_7203 [Actinoplanes sp. SE50]SLM04035.1 hypothetical protein ACSP50_7334 [Actinoplanes sp. SE50/110]
MVDVDTPAKPDDSTPDNTTRVAAIWATAIAVPVVLIVGLVAYLQISRSTTPAADPAPSASGPAVVPTTPVRVDAPELDARAAQVCLAVTSQLPARIRNLPARKVSAGPEQNAAYGEPAITVACGVTRPWMCEKADDTSGTCVPLVADLLLMDQVCWYYTEGAGKTVFTTMDREVPVQVTVPATYDKRAQWANEFSDIVLKTDKSITAGVPNGCDPGR